MTDLRKLLIECKELIDADAADALKLGQSSEWEYFRSLSGRIDAALADPVEPETWMMVEYLVDGEHRKPCHLRVVSKIAYDTLQSALKLAQEERDKFKDYWLAIDNRMVVLHLGTADSFDADTCMNKILEWETTIALDPQVSRPAQELKDTHLQRAEKAEEVLIQHYCDYDFTPTFEQATEMMLAERKEKKDVEEKYRRMVELLKEPSEGMVDAAEKADREYTDRQYGKEHPLMQQGSYDHWKAMSEQLLKEIDK